MSKVFDRIWHDELIYKTAFLKLINLLENRLQKVVLNDQTTSWEPALASVTQGLVLEPLFFLIYINVYLKIKKIIIDTKLFADGTSIFPLWKVLFLQINLIVIYTKFQTGLLSDTSSNPDPEKQTPEVIFFLEKEWKTVIHQFFSMIL